jgi:hypothetical protein
MANIDITNISSPNVGVAPLQTAPSNSHNAGFVSPTSSDFLNALGTNQEKSQQYMDITSVNDLYGRLSQYTNNTISSTWEKDFYSVSNYLLYGGNVCVVGSSDPYHKLQKEMGFKSIDTVFSSDESNNNKLAAIGTARRCIAVIGIRQTKYIGNTTSSSSALSPALPPNTAGDRYQFLIVGQKLHDSFDGSSTISSLLSADVAGLMAEKQHNTSYGESPAGYEAELKNGKLEFPIDSDSANYILAARANYFKTIAGKSVLFSDTTKSDLNTDSDALKYVNGVRIFTHIESGLETIADQAMFKVNDARTRKLFTNRATTMLRKMLNAALIDEFTVICDESNNPASIINANILKVYVLVAMVGSIQRILLEVNTNRNNNTTTITATTATTTSSVSSTSTSRTTTRSTSSTNTSSGSSY